MPAKVLGWIILLDHMPGNWVTQRQSVDHMEMRHQRAGEIERKDALIGASV